MTNIVRDLKDWYNASVDKKHKEMYLRNYKESITVLCDSSIFSSNLYNEKVFYTALTNLAAVDNFKKYYETRDQKSVTCRATSCFYKCVGKKSGEVFECINVQDKEGVGKNRCCGCVNIGKITRYQLLKSLLEQAQQKQEKAKQKLLDNFRFPKQK